MHRTCSPCVATRVAAEHPCSCHVERRSPTTSQFATRASSVYTDAHSNTSHCQERVLDLLHSSSAPRPLHTIFCFVGRVRVAKRCLSSLCSTSGRFGDLARHYQGDRRQSGRTLCLLRRGSLHLGARRSWWKEGVFDDKRILCAGHSRGALCQKIFAFVCVPVLGLTPSSADDGAPSR
jgi:hypothetical protein